MIFLKVLIAIGTGYIIGLYVEGIDEKPVWNPLNWFNICKYLAVTITLYMLWVLIARTN